MRIGFIGLGIMGEAMCYNIIRKHDGAVYIYDINEEPVKRLAAKGGIACGSSLEVARHSDVIITMLPRSENVMAVYNEILPSVNATKICIDMSTIDPEISLKVSVMIQVHGGHFLDAPVVRSQAAAVLGNVGIYVGGEQEIYQQVKPILQYMGSNILYMGASGKGIGMKICQTVLLAQIQNGVNEALAMAIKQGIDIDRFSAALSCGGGQNAFYDNKQMAIKNKDYTTTFSVENMAKDVDICMRLAKAEGIETRGLTHIQEIYEQAMTRGYGDKDYCSVIDVLFDNNHVYYEPDI